MTRLIFEFGFTVLLAGGGPSYADELTVDQENRIKELAH